MHLILAHAPNPDIAHDERRGYWSPPVDDGAPTVVEPTSLEEAQMMVERYIARNQLGGGNWGGVSGLLFARNHVFRIAYNGRLFAAVDPDEPEHAQAIARRHVSLGRQIIRVTNLCVA